jgi:peptide/nickel transport system permease protein
LEHKLGFDRPLPVQYWAWASRFLLGDMGQSMVMERPVAPMLWDAFDRSAILAVAAMAVVSIVGPTLGLIAAVWRGRWPDHVASVFAYLGISVPEFYWGLAHLIHGFWWAETCSGLATVYATVRPWRAGPLFKPYL